MPHPSRHWLVGVLAAVLASSALLVPTLTSAFDARRAPGPAAAPLDAPAIPDGEFVTRSGILNEVGNIHCSAPSILDSDDGCCLLLRLDR